MSTLRVGTGSGTRPDATAAGAAEPAVGHATVRDDLPARPAGAIASGRFLDGTVVPPGEGAAVRLPAGGLAGEDRTIGFPRHGELARTSGVAGFHNATPAVAL